MGGAVLKWFGYGGDSSRQKIRFKSMLDRNNIGYKELTNAGKEVKLYPTIQEELSTINDGARASAKFLIMEPDDLKMAIMQLKTKNGNIVRQYYIDLEKLLKLYVEYTLYFNHRESQRKISNLEQMMVDMNREREKDREIMLQQTQYMRSLGISLEQVKDQNDELLDQNSDLKKRTKSIQRKLGIAVEDRAPLPEDSKKQERFVLFKRNDPNSYPYSTIRAQSIYVAQRLRSQKFLYSKLEVLLDFKCNPNSKTLYVRIKDKLKAKGVVFKGIHIDLQDTLITEQELIEEMKVINNERYEV